MSSGGAAQGPPPTAAATTAAAIAAAAAKQDLDVARQVAEQITKEAERQAGAGRGPTMNVNWTRASQPQPQPQQLLQQQPPQRQVGAVATPPSVSQAPPIATLPQTSVTSVGNQVSMAAVNMSTGMLNAGSSDGTTGTQPMPPVRRVGDVCDWNAGWVDSSIDGRCSDVLLGQGRW